MQMRDSQGYQGETKDRDNFLCCRLGNEKRKVEKQGVYGYGGLEVRRRSNLED